jgi:hypothetical protein
MTIHLFKPGPLSQKRRPLAAFSLIENIIEYNMSGRAELSVALPENVLPKKHLLCALRSHGAGPVRAKTGLAAGARIPRGWYDLT